MYFVNRGLTQRQVCERNQIRGNLQHLDAQFRIVVANVLTLYLFYVPSILDNKASWQH